MTQISNTDDLSNQTSTSKNFIQQQVLQKLLHLFIISARIRNVSLSSAKFNEQTSKSSTKHDRKSQVDSKLMHMTRTRQCDHSNSTSAFITCVHLWQLVIINKRTPW